MKKFIVTTTINSPTVATLKFIEIAKRDNWHFVVVGDTKTPHAEYERLDCIYLHPDNQDLKYPKLSKIIGWKTIQRRNIGFVYAYEHGADVVATVDDDNIPYDNWGTDLYVGKEVEVDYYTNKELLVFDPLSVTNQSNLWHRGFPIDLLHLKNNIEYRDRKSVV
jgi:hypothetical protein